MDSWLAPKRYQLRQQFILFKRYSIWKYFETNSPARASRSSLGLGLPQCKRVEQHIAGAFSEEPAQIEVFRVEDTALDPIAKERDFYFFSSADCYIMKYTYPFHNTKNYLLYLWQGADSSLKLRRTSSVLAKIIDRRLHGKVTQVRVVQGHEPSHLRRLLKGNMVVYLGNRGPLFHGSEAVSTGARLFQVRSTCIGDGQATEVPLLSSSLNSEDAFILETQATSYLWYGKGCTTIERYVADNVCRLLTPHGKIIFVEEGSEFGDFWNILGGRLTYSHGYHHHHKTITIPLRLYHCVLVDHGLRLDIIYKFDQNELLDDDVSIIDSGDNIYVWIGSHSTEEEKELAIERAQEILDENLGERSDEAVVVAVRRGYEPPGLVNLFPSWKEEYLPDESNPDEQFDDEIKDYVNSELSSPADNRTSPDRVPPYVFNIYDGDASSDKQNNNTHRDDYYFTNGYENIADNYDDGYYHGNIHEYNGINVTTDIDDSVRDGGFHYNNSKANNLYYNITMESK